MKDTNNQLKLLAAFILGLSISACSENKTTDEYISEAQTLIQNKNYNEAVIQLKNAVKLAPKNAASRMLLGKLSFLQGNYNSAVKELIKALELGGNVAECTFYLVQSYSKLHEFEDVYRLTNEAISLNDAEYIPILTFAGITAVDEGDQAKAKEYLNQAVSIDKASVYGQLSSAYLAYINQEFDRALELTNTLLSSAPEMSESLLLQGNIYLAKNNFKSASESFASYLLKHPSSGHTQLMEIYALLNDEQIDLAEKKVDSVLAVYKEAPLAKQFKAQITYLKKDYLTAIEYAEQSINSGLNSTENRLVAGISAYKLDRFELSYRHLISVIDELPLDHPVRNILIVVQNELGYFSEAAELLKKSDLDDKDFNLLALMSQKLMQTGKSAQAKELIDKSKDIRLNTAESNFARGVFRLSLNDLEGILDLEKSLALSPELTKAKQALITAYISQGQNTKAIALAQELIQQSPDGHMGYILLARSYLANKDIVASEKVLREGYSINPTNNVTILFLTNLLMAKNEWQEARSILEKQLTVKPVNAKILTTYYQASKLAGETHSAVQAIENAAKNDESREDLRLLYGSVLYAEDNFKAAIKELENLNGAKLESEVYWIALGDSYIKVGDYEQAKTTLEEAVQHLPNYKILRLKLADVYEKLNSFHLALKQVKEGLIYHPKDEKLLSLSIYYSIRIHDYIGADTIVGALPASMQSTPLIKALKGQILYGMKKYEESIDYLKIQYGIEPNTRHIALLATAYYKSEQGKEAIKALEKHLKNNEKDTFAKGLLAEYAMVHDINLAQKNYEDLLKSYPNNVLILNNLAWIEYTLKNYTKAKLYIDKALVNTPENSKVNDTLGMIYLATGKVALAIATFEKALEFAPDDKEIINHLKEAQSFVKK